jgi:hypothetical protein
MMAAAHSTWVTALKFLMIIAGGIATIAAIAVGFNQMRAARNRSGDLRSLAARLGFEDFNPDRDEAFAMGWGFLDRLAQGEDRYAFNILRGTYHGQRLFVFDYHYRTGAGKNQTDHLSTVLMLVVQEIFPQVTISPGRESLLTKVAAAFGGGDDIKFESAEFARYFHVRSKDKRFAYDVCNAQMLDYLLANRDLAVEIQGPVLLLAFAPQLPVGQIEYNLQRLVEIRSRLPEYLFTKT